MSKGLEALKEYRSQQQGVNVHADEYLDIIEKELKEYEGAKNHIEALHKERVENSLKIKALEVIKSKEINIHALLLHLKRFDSPDGYNMLVGDKYKITQEDFDLLKEVLL